MESLSLPPLQTAEGGLLGYASQRLPAVLIGAGLRQSISPCPSLREKQWEIKNTQLAGRGGLLMGPYLRPEVSVNTHNPLSPTASYEAASHANVVTSCPPPPKDMGSHSRREPEAKRGGGKAGSTNHPSTEPTRCTSGRRRLMWGGLKFNYDFQLWESILDLGAALTRLIVAQSHVLTFTHM